MIVITVLYPAGHLLDLDYYRETHLPLVRRLMEPMGMQELSYFLPPDTDPAAPYQLAASLTFDTMATATAAMAAHGAETQADIPNFTAAPPTVLMGAAHPG